MTGAMEAEFYGAKPATEPSPAKIAFHPLACGLCAAFAPTDRNGVVVIGECRRHSPRTHNAQAFEGVKPGLFIAVWPAVAAIDWCLEHMRAPGASANLVQEVKR